MVLPIIRLLVTSAIAIASVSAIAAVAVEGYQRWRRNHQQEETPQRQPSTARRNNQVAPTNEPASTECIICDELLGFESITTTLPCLHRFHRDCYFAFQMMRKMNQEADDVCPILGCRNSNSQI